MKKKIVILFLAILGLTALLGNYMSGILIAQEQDHNTAQADVSNEEQMTASDESNLPEDAQEDTEQADQIEEVSSASAESSSDQSSSEAAATAPLYDIESRKRKTIDLVNRGVDYFKKHSMEKVCHDFTQTKKFIDGELYLFLFDYTGTNLAHGQQADLVWKNLYDLRDSFGTLYVQEFIKKAKEGGGWVTYQWRGATKITYVKQVTKDEKTYLIGCGFYPHSKEDAVVSLVKGAAALFDQVQKSGFSKDEAFSIMSYPLGKFLFGDLYIYALDFNGNIFAQGDVPALIGTNSLDYKDATGKKPNREIIERLKKTDQGIWIEYTSKNAKKRTYAQKVQDHQGNFYFIACGYYPDADRDAAQNLVRKGFAYMKKHGEGAAAQEFTGPTKREFRYGDLYLFLYDMNGVCVAHGGNPTYVGQNHMDRLDQAGRPYVREYIEKAKKSGSGWVNAKLNNSFQSAYVEKIDLGLKSYVIGSSLYPISKNETMVLLSKSAASFLTGNPREKAFNLFSAKDGMFVRGDLGVFTFDSEGICYAYGDDLDMVWRNMFNAKDDDGRPWVKLMINKVKSGAGTVVYKLNGADVIAHVEQVVKNGKTYVVGSSYYK